MKLAGVVAGLLLGHLTLDAVFVGWTPDLTVPAALLFARARSMRGACLLAFSLGLLKDGAALGPVGTHAALMTCLGCGAAWCDLTMGRRTTAFSLAYFFAGAFFYDALYWLAQGPVLRAPAASGVLYAALGAAIAAVLGYGATRWILGEIETD